MVYPYMNEDNFIKFEDFYETASINTNNKSQEEILIEVKELLRKEWIDGTV